MEKLITAYYDRFLAELDLNLPHSVYFEMITARLSMMIAECQAELVLARHDADADARHLAHTTAKQEALIMLCAEVTVRGLTLFLQEGFTEEEQADYYPKEMGDWGEGA